jgi:valyl-tRNA synthetase
MSALINTREKKNEAFLTENIDTIKKLSRLSDLKVGKMLKPKNSAAGVIGNFEVYVPLEGLIDFEKERAGLKKEESRLTAEIKSITERLVNKNFTQKAPADVIEKQKNRKVDLEIQIKKLKDNLKNIG